MNDLLIRQVAFHRNGVGGLPFYAVLFRDPEVGEMVATLLPDESANPGACFVLRIPDLSDPARGVTFGLNSWRGDYYEAALRRAIREADLRGAPYGVNHGSKYVTNPQDPEAK